MRHNSQGRGVWGALGGGGAGRIKGHPKEATTTKGDLKTAA